MHVVFTLANNSTAPYFLWFAQMASGTGYRFTFVMLHHQNPALQKQIQHTEAKCYWIPFDHRKRKKSLPGCFIRLILLFRKIKPDVVHSHLFDDAFPSLTAAWLCGIKKRVLTKGDAGFHWIYSPGAVIFDRWNNRMASHIVAISEENRNFILKNEKANFKKIFLIHHGIPREFEHKKNDVFIKEIRDRYKLNGKKIIGSVSRFVDWKGHRFIIEAAAEIIKKNSGVKFVLLGQGPEKSKIEKLIQKYELSDFICIIDTIEHEKMTSFYASLDVFVHAATLEPFGFVITEAMLCGIPVVSTRTGVAADCIRHLENGYLTDCRNSKGLAEGIEYMLYNDTTEMCTKAKNEIVQHYSFETMWEKHLNLYLSDTH